MENELSRTISESLLKKSSRGVEDVDSKTRTGRASAGKIAGRLVSVWNPIADGRRCGGKSNRQMDTLAYPFVDTRCPDLLRAVTSWLTARKRSGKKTRAAACGRADSKGDRGVPKTASQ